MTSYPGTEGVNRMGMKDPAGSKAKASSCRVIARDTRSRFSLTLDRPPTFSRMSAASVSSSPAFCSFELLDEREDAVRGNVYLLDHLAGPHLVQYGLSEIVVWPNVEPVVTHLEPDHSVTATGLPNGFHVQGFQVWSGQHIPHRQGLLLSHTVLFPGVGSGCPQPARWRRLGQRRRIAVRSSPTSPTSAPCSGCPSQTGASVGCR